jgi:ComF family protein
MLSIVRHGFLNVCVQLVHTMLPQRCLLCGAPAPPASPVAGASAAHPLLCADCDADLPRLAAARCTVCALPLPSGAVCGACLNRPPRFDRVSAPYAYRFPVDALIHAFKYGGRLAHAAPLAAALAGAVPRDADVIVPMPLAPRRLAQRGFNQALELARVVAARTGIALAADACRKVLDTVPQAALPWQERAKNVRRAFVCDADFTGLRVAVVDDVLTTGATLSEIARVLRRAGAISVAGWVVARTLPR